MKSLLSSSMGRQSPSFTQRMEAKKRQEEEEEERQRMKRDRNSSASNSSAGLSSSYNSNSSLRSFLYSSSPPSQSSANSPHSTRSEGNSIRSDLSSQSAMSSSVVIEGFLTKQGQRFKTWKRRWCVVLADPTPTSTDDSTVEDETQLSRRRAKLYYAKQPQSRSSRGEVTLDHFSVVDISTGSLDEEAMALHGNDLMPTVHCFCINTQKRVYYFCCDTEDDLVRWQRALQSLLPSRTKSEEDRRREPRLEREVRHLFRDLQEVMLDGHDNDFNVDNNDAADDDVKGKEAARAEDDEGDLAQLTEEERRKATKKKKEAKRRAKEKEWLRVVQAEMQQAETIEDEDERREEWMRIKQVLSKRMERALLRADRRRAELTLRAAAARASTMAAGMRAGAAASESESEGEAAKKQKNEDGKKQQKRESEREGRSGFGRKREKTRRDDGVEEDGWNSDGFDTSREATMAREIMGKRSDDDDSNEDDSDGDEPSQRLDDEEDEIERRGLMGSDTLRKSRRQSRGRKKVPTRRVYSYGREETQGFEGEMETERGDGTGSNYGTYPGGSHHSLRHDDLLAQSSSSSFWCCFRC